MKKNNKGFSLIEIVVVLAIMGVIAAFLTPMLFNYMSDSKIRRAQNDVQQIASAIGNFNADTGIYPVYNALPCNKTNATVESLVTGGINAEIATDMGLWNDTNSGGSDVWANTANACLLEKHLGNGLVVGGASYNDAAGVKNPNKWRGPYMEDFGKRDPWGNRYYVSTVGLQPGSDKAAFVLSAGPNATIDTLLTQTIGTNTPSISVGSDDIAYKIK